MAGGKETPRQKMIGLMYLVLTAMLALNVSKAVLWGYISVSESMDKSLKNIEFSNKQITEAFKASIDGNPKAAPYYEEAVKAQKLLHEMIKYVDDVKGNIIRDVLDIPEGAKVLGDTVKLRWAPVKDKVDNYDKPTYLMLGSEAHSEQDGPLRAKELKTKLNELHDKLLAQLEQMQKTDGKHLLQPDYESLKKKYAIIKPTDSGREEDKLKYTWAMDNFYHLPLGAVFVNMQKIQIDVKNAETEMLQSFSGASGKLAIKPDKLSAKVLAESNYISAGGRYAADIILLASFSKLKEGDMEVMLGIDSAAAVKGSKGTAIKVVDGVGKYEASAGAPGDVKYQGVVKFKKPDGTFEYYPFAQEYKVAPSAVAVSADLMQVFYRGVENPVTAGVAGRSPQDISISANGAGAKYKQTGPGKYIFTFSGIGDCFITVSAKEKEGVKAQGAPIKFRVKPLPKPEAKLGQKFAPQEIKITELQAIRAIGAGAPGFDFQANYIVQSYEILGKVKGQVRPAAGNGSNLDQNALNILRNLDVGSKFYIDLKVKGPDGIIYPTTCGIKVIR
jgi:gliding motility-associated protein GldM